MSTEQFGTKPEAKPDSARGGIREITVVGGGLIGLFTALYGHEAGYRVRVIERSVVGSGASRGNAGEICPSMANPMPAPGMVRNGLANSLAEDAALRIHLPPSIALSRWLLAFARNCRPGAYEHGFEALSSLSTRSFRLFEQLPDLGVATTLSQTGNLKCYADPARAERDFAVSQRVSRFGLPTPTEMISGDAIRELAPVVSEKVTAGYHWPAQWFVDPSVLVNDLHARLLAVGVEFREHTEVTRVTPYRNAVVVHTDGGDIETDAVVIASGAWSPAVLRSVGVRAPIQSGKGYSFSVTPDVMPNHVINMSESNAVATPMGDRLRIGGTVEFDGTMDKFNPSRIERIIRAARPYLTGIDWEDRSEEWVGPRPMTPDGLPLIGRSDASDRVVVAAGHNMLGLTLGPASAELAISALGGHTLPGWSDPFDANRFGRRWAGRRPLTERTGMLVR
ncbi:FAD-dependent oxidoreductase [Cryobacterium melibiosiphilum]|uniref:FAD-dependent oxidoreductase n=1 Tax=Cryobacterium melibiosiphilum TaxID=995039 RepID=A0A3A5MPY7_9MICO|nr:FAD-dependent oxidoreductase [Cryobacterium melibiosiphilum]RJT89023.1 FAD-dependent oxidoreductase [Cryobacterium melibiosiphilum]